MAASSLVLFVVLILIWNLGLTFWLVKTLKHYNNLTRKSGASDLTTILDRLLSKQTLFDETIKKIQEELVLVKSRERKYFQKIGLVRFSPYSDTGGDRSFALSLLNSQDTGVVILSLHGREGTRVYVKPISRGVSAYTLSKEEKQAVEQTKRNKIVS